MIGEDIKALSYFNSAVGEIYGKKDDKSYKDVLPRARYQIALVKEKLNHSVENILEVINKGIKISYEGSEFYEKLSKLALKFEKLLN